MIATRYISPLSDFGFKKLFGTEKNKVLIIDLLNAIITDQGEITDIRHLPTEQLGTKQSDRIVRFDVYCQNEKETRFIVEMQKTRKKNFKERIVYYSTFPISGQAEPGEDWDYELKPVYAICIMNFVFEEYKDNPDLLRHDVKLVNIATGDVFYKKLNYIFLELPKVKITENELDTSYNKWLYALKNLPNLENQPEQLQGCIFDILFHETAVANLRPVEMAEYTADLKADWDRNSELSLVAEENWEEGAKKGREKGRLEGKLETARNLRQMNMSEQDIMKATGLSEEELKNIK